MIESASKSEPCDSEHKGVWVTLLNGLLASVLVTGCSGLGDDAGWLDYFEAVDSLHVSDSTLTQLLSARDSAPNGLWRVPGLGSNAWLVSPAAGRRAAEDLMGLPPDVWEVPYWPSWASILGAKLEGIVFGATNLTYVVRVYGDVGSWRDSIFAAPPSWRQAHRPEPGEFESATTGEVRAYFGTFNVITGLAAVSEGVLIVTHGRRIDVADDPDGSLKRLVGGRPTYRGMSAISDYVNVYGAGKRVVTDASTPGEILGYGPGRVVFGKRMTNQSGYILSEFALRRSSELARWP